MDGIAPGAESAAGSPPVGMPSESEVMSFLSAANSAPEAGNEPIPAPAAESTAVAAQPEATPAGGPSPVEPAPVAQPETPAATEQGPIPYTRFQEVVGERNAVRTQLQEFQPFQPVIELARQANLTPSEVAARLLTPPAPPPAPEPPAPEPEPVDPAKQLEEYWQAKGVDVYELDAQQFAQHQALFETIQSAESAKAEALKSQEELKSYKAQLEAQAAEATKAQQESQQKAQLAAWQADLAKTVAANPEFAGEDEQRALIAFWDTLPEDKTLADAASRMKEMWQIGARNSLAQEAVEKHKQEVAQRPQVAGGGTSVSPSVTPNYAQLGPKEMEDVTLGWLQTMQKAA
jgi:hypothetical protein